METAERVTVLGIDPGRNTGLYSVSIPKMHRALSVQEFENHARWLGNAVIRPKSSKVLSPKETWGWMAEDLSQRIHDIDPDLIVLEYPADGMPKWSGGTARGTDFGIGMFFGFALLACRPHLNMHIALVPVTSSAAKKRVGWMPRVRGKRNNLHTQDRETTLRQCREIAHCLGQSSAQSSEDVDALSDHELMALGVLTYYVTNRAPAEWGK